MIVFGIDPGSSVTGYSVVEESNGHIKGLDWGAIRPKATLPFPKRIKHIFDKLTENIKRYSPDVIAIEDIFISNNPKSALKLGQARGASLVAAANSPAYIAEYTALNIKQSVVGYGRASKEQVREMVIRLLNLKKIPTPFDASDALAVAICHIYCQDYNKYINRAKTRCV